MRIDLHAHSLNSDGSDTPAAVVQAAAAVKIDVLALTDHDTTSGWAEASEAAERVGIRLIRGIEFSVTDIDQGRHLLGYGMDPEHPQVAEILAKAATSREDRIGPLLDGLEALNLPVDREWLYAAAGGIPSRKHIAAALVRAGHVASDDEAFRLYLNQGGPAYIQRYRPTVEEAIAAIRDGGGVAVIAHPHDVKRGPVVTEARFAELQQAGLVGIEVDHQGHPAEVREHLRAIAANLGLIVTGSSDYHGTRKENHELGCNLTSPESAAALLGADVLT